MNEYIKAISKLNTPESIERIASLYGDDENIIKEQIDRYTKLIKKHEELYNVSNKLWLISAPGRIEICGNHTDHNNGKVLAAAINKDAAAVVSAREDNLVNVYSKGYGSITVDLSNLEFNKDELGTTISLVKGVASKLKELNYNIGGFDAVVFSTVLTGSGLSSSAAMEVLFCAIFDHLFNGNIIDPVLKAQISQYAENVYFGKPSGSMDQSASSIGGLIYMDYKEKVPTIKKANFDFSKYGFSIMVVNTNSSHDDLTDKYAAIPDEMKKTANFFGKKVLREINLEQVLQNISVLRDKFGERPILRALHYFYENKRVDFQLNALESKNIQDFLNSVIESGRSSFMYLQNIYANEKNQPMSLALVMSEHVLSGYGAWRVHGGGFAGTTLNFVPKEKKKEFVSVMESMFGKNCCYELNIRPEGPAII